MIRFGNRRLGAYVGRALRGFLLGLGGALGHLAALTLAFHPVIAAAQSIRIDPSAPRFQQPNLGHSGNNKPVINIAPPSSGISHNRFKDLSTHDGLIFNNSKVGGQSTTGGAVSGNSNLAATGPANVILNEVRGTGRTRLRGVNEIFGAKADLIIANENGVDCASCSFVNTRNATLTTGRPIVNGANIALHVSDGTIGIFEGGLSGADNVNLVGRHVIVDGKVQANNQLTVSGGSQVFNHNTGEVRAAPSTKARSAPYAVDATALGALSANQIRVIGNESGLGVNLGSKLSAGGNLTVKSKGSVRYGDISAGGKATIEALGDVKQSKGQAYAKKGVQVAARSFEIAKDAKLISSGPIALNLSAYSNISGEVRGSSVTVRAEKSSRNFGRVIAATDIAIVAGEIENRRGTINTGYDETQSDADAWLREYTPWMEWYIRRNPGAWNSRYYRSLVTRAHRNTATTAVPGTSVAENVKDFNVSGQLFAYRDAKLSATAGRVYNTGRVTAVRNLTITAKTDIINRALLFNDGGQICAPGGCAATKTAHHAYIEARGDATLTAGRDVTNIGSNIYGIQNLDITAGRNINNQLSYETLNVSKNYATIGAVGRTYNYTTAYYNRGGKNWLTRGRTWYQFINTRDRTYGTHSSVRYTGLRRGYIYSNGNLTLNAGQDINSAGSYLRANATLKLTASRYLNLANRTFTAKDTNTYKVHRDHWTYNRNRATHNYRAVVGYKTKLQKYSVGGGRYRRTRYRIVRVPIYQNRSLSYLTNGQKYVGHRVTVSDGSHTNTSVQANYGASILGHNINIAVGKGGLVLPHAINADGNVSLTARGNITASHNISVGGNLSIASSAGTLIAPSRMITAGGTAALNLRGSFDNHYLRSGRNLNIRVGGTLINRNYIGSTGGRVDIYAASQVHNNSYTPSRAAEIYGRTGLKVDAGGHVYNYNGGKLASYGTTEIVSRNGGIYSRGVVDGRHNWSTHTGAVYGQEVFRNGWYDQVRYAKISGRDVILRAKGDISLVAAHLSASNTLSLDAGGQIFSRDLATNSYQHTRVRNWYKEAYKTRARLSCRGVYFAGRCYKSRSRRVTYYYAYVTKHRWKYKDKVSAATSTRNIGSILRGKDISLNAGSVSLSGLDAIANQDLSVTTHASLNLDAARRMQAGRDANLTSTGGYVTFRSDFSAGRDLNVDAHASIINYNSTLTAGRSALFRARNGHIQNLTRVDRFRLTKAHGCEGRGCSNYGYSFTPAQIIAGSGGLVLSARYDILNRGGTLRSAGDTFISAGRDFKNEAIAKKYTYRDYHRVYSKKKWYGKRTTYEWRRLYQRAAIQRAKVVTGGDLLVTVGRDLWNVGSLLQAQDALDITAGRNITASLASVELKFIKYYKKSKSFLGWRYGGGYGSSEWNDFKVARSEIKGGRVWLHAGGDFTAHGATVSSRASLSLVADGNIFVLPVQHETYSRIASGKSGIFSKKKHARTTRKTNTRIAALDADRDLSLLSNSNDIIIQAGGLNAGGDLTIVAERGQILFLTAREGDYERIETYDENAVWWRSRDKGHYIERAIHSHLQAGGTLSIRGAGGVIVEYQENGTKSDSIRQLAKTPSLAWIAELKTRNDVEWRAVEGVVERWDHEAEGLTQGGAALIALAVTIASAGTASALAGAVSGAVGGGALGTAAGSAVSAGFKAIVSRAAVSLVNNKGNIGAVLRELGSSQSIKSLAATVLTAGLISAIPTDVLAVPGSAANTVIGQIQSELIENATQGVIQASVETAISGGEFSDALVRNLKTAAVASLGSVVAAEIGASYRSNDIDYITHKVLHAALGCAVGAAGSGGRGCASGAFGGVTGEILAEAIKDDILEMQAALARGNGTLTASEELDYTQRIIFWGTYGVDIAKLAAGFGALATGLDVNVASTAAGNAAKNNAFFLIPLAVYAAKAALLAASAYGAYQTGAELYKIATVLSSNAPEAEKNAIIQEALGSAALNGVLTVGGLSGLKLANALANKYGVDASDLYKWLGPKGREAVDQAADAWNRSTPSVIPDSDLVRSIQAKLSLYPAVIDPRTGRSMPFPSGILGRVPRDARVDWTSKERGAFIKEWYDRGYETPRGGWENYDIHHIQPREFGGTNDFWNLVPVDRGTHQNAVNSFWRSFTEL